jgi:predicted transcriptional regulator
MQEDLAHDTGITVAALARIERGQANPRWTTIKGIASALGHRTCTRAQHG